MLIKPMLAHTWDKYNHKIKYPCYVQPKLDGMRCLAVREGDTISYLSRTLKSIHTVDHLTKQLLKVMRDGEIFDGELYCHGVPFQTQISWIKRMQADTERIQYHVYDTVTEYTYEDRLRSLYRDMVTVYTLKVYDPASLDRFHRVVVESGYEGTIIRNSKGKYTPKRSFDLLKRKDWMDEEFTIDHVNEGKGKFLGCAVFVLRCGDDQFSCTAPGSVKEKQAFWEDRELMVGKPITVKFQEKTERGIPRFPIAIGVRDYEN